MSVMSDKAALDPHGPHLEDSIFKLQGFASYAERYGDSFERIQATIKDGSKWRVLDLKRPDVRAAIAGHTGSVEELYESHRGLSDEQTALELD